MEENHSDIINRLKKSKFRNSFSLKQKDFDYINRVGMAKSKQCDKASKKQKRAINN